MTSSLTAEPPALPLLGDQRPRLLHLPPGIASTAQGEDAVEFAARSGLLLDDWQEFALVNGMSEDDAGLWAAFEVVLILSRQNGKNEILRARELAGLYLVHEELIIHTAHKFNASAEHYRKIKGIILANDNLLKRVKRNGFCDSHGKEGIELKATAAIIMGSGARLVRKSVSPRLLFFARSGGQARSFTCNCLVWDEAMILEDSTVGDAMPTLSTVRNAQIWYTGSAGRGEKAAVLARVRRRGIAGDDPSLVLMEWSIFHCTGECAPGCKEHDDPHDPRSHAKANPAYGGRLTEAAVRRELRSMAPNGVRVWPPDQFATERLGVGEWPADEDAWSVISEQSWSACCDPDSPRPKPKVAIAVDSMPDGLMSAIAVAGVRDDGRTVIEIPEGDHRPGTAWVVERLKVLKDRHKPCAIVIDPRSPAGELIDGAEKAGLTIVKPTTAEVAQACGQFKTKVTARPPQVAHTGQPMLTTALAGADKRIIGDGAWAWARKDTDTDICPLVAVTMAAWASAKFGRPYDPLRSVAGASDFSKPG